MNVTIYIIPVAILSLMIYANFKGINAYDSFIKGAKEGVKYVYEILPYVASMIIATTVFRSSNVLQDSFKFLFSSVDAFYTDIMTLAFFRPISGVASLAVLHDILKGYGPDSFPGMLASTIQGGTDTTLYIITVYFGAIGIKESRYALKAGLLVDIISFICAFFVVKYYLL
ncbi:spore maturation protein [Haloplasma contractile]|uniref:Spore maturation protein B n=1 Tax=Haloplasma contractile SSD-17B TaxID=1033810 RepID=F7PVM7_9MOLU|nr:spore maturation protein [Haloplasma contractile]ERJ12807.1 Spore maturation protein B [Haloplasma contractile SSD-17B]